MSPTSTAGADNRVRQARGDRRRQRILDVAVELFGQKGFRGTGVAALAKAVGMTTSGLLYYFGTKERLLREVVDERDRIDASSSDLLTLRGLRNLGRHNQDTHHLVRLYTVLGAESFGPEDPLHDFFVDRYEIARAFSRELLRAEQAAGRLRPGVDVAAVAAEMVATMMGFEIQWLTDPARIDLGTAMETYIDRLCEAVLLPEGGAQD